MADTQAGYRRNQTWRAALMQRVIAAFALAGVLAPAASLAADGKDSGGLPQFDVTTWPGQIFWLIVVFASLYIYFGSSVLPRISGVIENRRNRIMNDQERADALRNEAQAVRQAYEASLNGSKEEAARLVAEAEQAVKDKAESELEGFRKRFDLETEKAGERIREQEQEILQEMNTIAAEAVTIAAGKIAGIKTDAATAERIVITLNSESGPDAHAA